MIFKISSNSDEDLGVGLVSLNSQDELNANRESFEYVASISILTLNYHKTWLF